MKLEEILSYFTSIIVLQVDKEGEILKEIINSKAELNLSDVNNIYQLFSPTEKYRLDRILDMDFDGRKKFMEMNKRFKIKEYVDIQVLPIEGKIYMYIEFFESRREMEIESDRHMSKLLELSEKDSMTKVLNRYGSWRRIKNLITCDDKKKIVGLIFVDIDNLKKVNDEKGHNVGDQAIIQISELLKNSVRSRDIVARMGGDEFLIVVEEQSKKKSSAKEVANRLVRNLKKDKKKYITTVSIGIHTAKVKDLCKYKSNEEKLIKKWEEEVKKADEAAYISKNNGKGKISTSPAFNKIYS